jgi:hypothetical protein
MTHEPQCEAGCWCGLSKIQIAELVRNFAGVNIAIGLHWGTLRSQGLTCIYAKTLQLNQSQAEMPICSECLVPSSWQSRKISFDIHRSIKP